MTRLISRVTVLRGDRFLSEMDRERLLSYRGGEDPGSQARWARRLAEELGEAGNEYREMAEKMEAGEPAFDLYGADEDVLDYQLQRKEQELSGKKEEAEPGDSESPGQLP